MRVPWLRARRAPRTGTGRSSGRLAATASAAASLALVLPVALSAPGARTAQTGAGGSATTSAVTGAPVGGTEISVTTTTSTTSTASAPLDPCAQPALHLRCPDLVMSAPAEMRLDRRTLPGRLLLRATSSVDSVGAGPMELRARRNGHGGWMVSQAIYDRSGRAHLYPTAVQLLYKYVPGERYGYGYVSPASYWKVRHVAAFELWSLDANMHPLALVRTGPKVDYCLRDLERTHPSRRSPLAPVYPACSQRRNITRDVFGTSVGWSDIYPYGYPEQWIDVTGLHGRFAFVQIANPDGEWHEVSVANNASESFVSLPSGRVLGERTGVPAP